MSNDGRAAHDPAALEGAANRPAHRSIHGQLGYLQLPAVDVAASAAFYEGVFGWQVDLNWGGFEAPGLIGQWSTELPVAAGGPLLWFGADDLYPTLERVEALGGAVRTSPQRDQGARFLVEVDDPAGNRIGIFVPVGPPQAQTLIAVRDVEASSRWYCELLGLRSGHGGPDYERLLAGDTLVLQLHRWEVDHHHGPIGDPAAAVGNGVCLWFGAVADFDATLQRAAALGAPVAREAHRNPPEGEGNGPGHREVWLRDPDGYLVVIASPDGEAYEPVTP